MYVTKRRYPAFNIQDSSRFAENTWSKSILHMWQKSEYIYTHTFYVLRSYLQTFSSSSFSFMRFGFTRASFLPPSLFLYPLFSVAVYAYIYNNSSPLCRSNPRVNRSFFLAPFLAMLFYIYLKKKKIIYICRRGARVGDDVGGRDLSRCLVRCRL